MRNTPDPKTMAEAFGTLRADYEAGQTSRFRRRLTGVSPTGSSADWHLRNSTAYWRMMEQAREFDRNNMIVGQAVDRVVKNVLQEGIRPDPQTGDSAINTRLAELFAAWSHNPDACDSSGERSFHALAKLALRQTLVDGDVFFLPLLDGRLEAIEAHRVRTPERTERNVVHGVLLDEHRRALEIWITLDDLGTAGRVPRVRDVRRVAVRSETGERQVFHLRNAKRFSQTRGVTVMAPIVNAVAIHDDLQFAQLIKAWVASSFAIFEEVEGGIEVDANAKTGLQRSEMLGDGTVRTLEGLAPGMRYRGEPGVKLQGFSPNIPNPEFFQHARMVLSFIAVNLDLPLVVLLLDPSETNFSGWRGAMDQARMGFRDIQGWMIDLFYRPIYLWKVRQWIRGDMSIARAYDALGEGLFAHRWNAPGWPYIEPSKDALADATRLKNRLISPRRMHAERGRDWDEVAVEIVEDNDKLARAALAAAAAINSEYPEASLDFRELIGWDVRSRVYAGQQLTRGRPAETRETAGSNGRSRAL